MKKLLLLFTMVASMAKSQISWCPPGATWHYGVNEASFLGYTKYNGVVEYKYTGDTVINSQLCKKIYGIYKGLYNTISNINTTIPGFGTSYTRLNNNVLYRYNFSSSSFDTVVDFNAKIGDKWRRFDACDATNKTITVTDTGRVTINNRLLKKIEVSAVISYTPFQSTTVTTYTMVGKFIELVLNDLYYTGTGMFPAFCDYKDMLDLTHPTTTFRCYSDNTFSLYKSGTSACDDITNLPNIKNDNHLIVISPNPANEFLTIRFSQNTNSNNSIELKLIDVYGREVKQISIQQNQQIDLSELSKGIYFLQVIEKGRLIAKHKIIKE